MKTLLQRLNGRTQRLRLALALAGAVGLHQHAYPQAATMIQDINSGSANSSPSLFTYCGGLNCIFFVADNGSAGSELWKYDISSATASLVRDINPGSGGSGITSIIVNTANNGIVFNASDGFNGNELWKSDGTSGGTMMLMDINPGSGNSTPGNFYIYGGKIIFSADNGANGKEPWLTTGNIGGTSMLKDINPGVTASDPNSFTPVAGKLVFRANDGTTGSELWITDQTSGGTVLLKDINPGSSPSVPLNLVTVGGNVFFSASDGTNGAELWKTDGTAGGTQLVKDINPGAGSSINISPGVKAFFTAYNNNLYFQATNGMAGYELWKSDGTLAGTVLLKDINSGPGSSTPSGMLATSTNMFFFANDGVTGMELWTSDGTSGGTTLLKDINPGAASGTTSLTTLSQGGVGSPIYFAATDANGTELWHTLGSAGSTTLIADINPGAASSTPTNVIAVGNIAYFAATDGVAGIEPWKFDPLAAGIAALSGDQAAFVMYPNPCSDVLNLSSAHENFGVKIFTIAGQMVYNRTFEGNGHASVDVSGLEAGIYLLKISGGAGESVKKIVISR